MAVVCGPVGILSCHRASLKLFRRVLVGMSRTASQLRLPMNPRFVPSIVGALRRGKPALRAPIVGAPQQGKH